MFDCIFFSRHVSSRPIPFLTVACRAVDVNIPKTLDAITSLLVTHESEQLLFCDFIEIAKKILFIRTWCTSWK